MNSIFSRDNLPRIEEGVYAISVDYKESKERNWDSLFIDRDFAVYFDSFGAEYIHQDVLNKIKEKSITQNKIRVKFDNSSMCGLYWIAFIEYKIAGKCFSDYTNLFSPIDCKKDDKIICKYLK